MRITQIDAYRVELPLHEGSYKWSGGNAVAVFDSTVVAVSTDEGITGYGEVCPLGPAYLPAYANGARTGIAELAPQLIGLDPTQLGVMHRAHGSEDARASLCEVARSMSRAGIFWGRLAGSRWRRCWAARYRR